MEFLNISVIICGTGIDFQHNFGPIEQLFNFRDGASGCDHFPKFFDLETLIFEFLIEFYILVPIFVGI